MEERKELGKITFAEFGQSKDRPFLFGLQLTFKMDGLGVGDGLKYTVNLSSVCRWNNEDHRRKAIEESIDNLNNILIDAGVNYVSELINKPVEITLDGNLFKDFRILTEVL